MDAPEIETIIFAIKRWSSNLTITSKISSLPLYTPGRVLTLQSSFPPLPTQGLVNSKLETVAHCLLRVTPCFFLDSH